MLPSPPGSTVPAAQTAQAQVPKTIRIVVPFPAGGPTDTTARVVADHIGKATGTSFVVENRPGGGSAIASEAVARATPDGGTLLIVAGALLINPILKKVNYDPLTSFEPICKMVRVPHFIVVNKDSPLMSFGDFIAAANAKPGELTFATVGPATGPHIAFEVLKLRLNAHIRFVPYPDTTPSINAVLAGTCRRDGRFPRCDRPASERNAARPCHHGAQADRAASRHPDRRRGAGYPGYEAESWFGLVAPAATPRTPWPSSRPRYRRPCWMPRSEPSSPIPDCFRPPFAARSSARICGSSTRSLAARSCEASIRAADSYVRACAISEHRLPTFPHMPRPAASRRHCRLQ